MADLKDIDVLTIDGHIEFLRNESSKLRQISERWAVTKVAQYNRVIETLTALRQDKQMRGMNGARIDQEAIDAAPELKGKHALVLYFQDAEGCREAAKELEIAFKEQRLVRTVKL
jgi:hypothetical protein